MTCEDREALDLFAVPHVIDVRLLKVLAFGRNAAAAAPPFTLRNRQSYHITNWVATALWNVDGHASQENGRLHIRLNGRLLRDPGAEITHTFAEPGMAIMAAGFRSLNSAQTVCSWNLYSTSTHLRTASILLTHNMKCCRDLSRPSTIITSSDNC